MLVGGGSKGGNGAKAARQGGRAQQLGVVRVTPRASQTSRVQLWPQGSGQEA